MGGWMLVAMLGALTLAQTGTDVVAPPETAHLSIAGAGAGGEAPAPPPPSFVSGPVEYGPCAGGGVQADPPSVQACAPVGGTAGPGMHTVTRGVHCVDHDDPTATRIRVVYARSFDGGPWQQTDDAIRALHLMANQRVDADGMRNDIHADLPTECQQGHIKVHRVVLWSPQAISSFQSITGDLQTRPDFNVPNVKYWVYYDGPDPQGRVPQVLGESTLPFIDDSAAATNAHNGFAVHYAVTYQSDWHTWLHEGAHTMGAVQLSATHSTNFTHAYDRLDIMAWNDGAFGGTFGPLYNAQPNNCTIHTFDCGEDDYFSTAPAPGSYLDNNWNLGAPYHAFIRLDGSHVRLPMLCDQDRTVPDAPVTCWFSGGNPDAAQVSFLVDWGDGTTSTVGPVPVGQRVGADHIYGASGTYRIHVFATDVAGAPNPSGGVPWDIKVDGTEPPLTVERPR